MRLWTLEAPKPAISAVALSRSRQAWLVGKAGYAAFRLKEGADWSFTDTNVTADLQAVAALGSDSAIAVGAWGTVLRFTGRWERIILDVGSNLNDVHFVDERQGWIVGDDGLILATSDGGTTASWVAETPGLTLHSIYVKTESGPGWAVGEWANGTAAVLHSTRPAEVGGWRLLRYHPAPWWFALLVFGFVPLGLVTVRVWLPEPQVIKSITGRATSDRPIGWKDADALKFRPMALALSRFLRNVNSTPPLTLAVTGRWGTGKSSLMGLLKEDLEQRGTRTVWFNAWHHRQEEHLFAALMEAIRTQAVPPLWHFGGLSFRGRLLWQRTTRMRAVLLAVLLFGGIVLGTVYLGLGERRDLYLDRGFEWVAASFSDVLRENEPATGSGTEAPDADSAADRQSVSTLDRLSEIPVVGSVLALFGALLTWMIRMKLIAFPANPAALMANVTNRMRLRSFRDRLDFRYEFGLALSEVASALRTPTKAGLVIFIDDLDRCQPEDTLKILESVNFIVSSGPCIVILGMDRHQVEHTAGLGFKEIIEGLSNQELVFASGEEVSEPARRKAFARLYLEKLINVEVPVPSMNESAARALLGVGDPDPHDQSQNVPAPWVGSVKRRLRVAFALAPIVLVPVFIGALTVPLVERVSTAGSPVLAPLPEAGASRGPASGLEGEVSGRPAPTAEPEQPEQFVPYPVRASPPQSGPDELPMPTGWLLWVATFLVVVVAVLWGLDAIMRRRQAIHRDSPDFMKALVAVEPVLRAHYETPRAIKRWQNRMRLAAEFLRPEGHDIDIIDRGMGWLGNRLGKNWIPQVWFETGLKPKTSEPALILMGAREAVDPATFSDTPEEIVERLRGTPSPSGTRSKDDSPAAKAWGDVIRTYRDFPEEPSAWPDVDDVRRYAVLMRSVDGRRESIRRSDAKDPNSRNGARRTTDRLRKHVQD